jgi:dethiobiotin synthetase/adenosylmethionine--8-amino-7-oxononanoate aminotransferase
MIFVDPLFQACMVEVVRSSSDLFFHSSTSTSTSKPQPNQTSYTSTLSSLSNRNNIDWQGLPIIYDEVFSGLHRFGYHSASTILTHTPDISVYAKILTGGLLPLSATLASSSIFNSFLSDKKVDALLHGHSYTANPIGCSVALKAIEMVENKTWDEERALWKDEGGERWSFWSEEFVKTISRLNGVKGSMAMGTVFALELEDQGGGGGYSSHVALDFLTGLRARPVESEGDEFEPFQIHSRPLGNVVYVMTSLFTKVEVMRAMEKRILEELTKADEAS